MTDAKLLDLRVAASEIKAARAMIEEGLNALSRAFERLEILGRQLQEHGIDQRPKPELKPTAHRRAHRSGRPPKIDTDPELQAFLLARAVSENRQSICGGAGGKRTEPPIRIAPNGPG